MSAGVPLASPEAMKTHVAEGFAAATDGYDADGTEFFQRAGTWLVEAVGVPPGGVGAGCGLRQRRGQYPGRPRRWAIRACDRD